MHVNEFYEAVTMAENVATKTVKMEMQFDTSRWSQRMQNIVCKAIDTGVANCGQKTAYWVEKFLQHHGLDTLNRGGWQRDLPLNFVKEDMIEDAVAYMAALARISPEIFSYGHGESHWLNKLDTLGISKFTQDEQNKGRMWNTEGICYIPVPDKWDKADQDTFYARYMKPQDEQQQIKRAELINLVRSGSLLSISYIIND